ncbi:MAG: twin-arginine translocase subunit TatB [Chloroflexi bacterium]|nr:MAG: twin-arginine translocase subunit TatB [Chloroflexota bacterium]
MFGIGGAELLVILLVAGIILGPERLARVGREAGKFIRNAKAYFSSLSGELKTELDMLDELRDVTREADKTAGDFSLKTPPHS